MIRLPQIALVLLLLVAAIPGLIGLCASGWTIAAIGWESISVWCVSGILAGVLWDRKLHQFNGIAPIVLATLAIAAFVVGLLSPVLDLAATGAVLSIMLLSSCLARKSNRTSLVGFAAVALPASIAAVPIVSTHVDDLVVDWATTTAGDLLHLANIAHITRGDVVTTAIERFPIGYRMQGWATWPVFASLALLYSALMGRNWLHSLAMAATAVPLCVAFHAGAIAMVSASDVWRWEWLPTDAWPWISALATAIAMLSVDRVFELLLKQIEADENASRANPVVHAWNLFVRRSKVRDSQPHTGLAMYTTASVLALLPLGFTALPVASRSISELATVRQCSVPVELTSIVKQGKLSSDHFSYDRIIKPEWGRIGDIWLATSSDALTQLSVLQTPYEGTNPLKLMGTPWTETSFDSPTIQRGSSESSSADATPPPASDEKEDSAKTQPAPERFVLPDTSAGIRVKLLVSKSASEADERSALKDSGHAISLDCMLGADGKVITGKQETPAYWIRLMRRSATKPNTRQAQELADQLDEILAAIQESITGAGAS